ncbi:MAG TPA: DEAD/DEAH box helicase [Myxococcota bacterium]|nr:DEAD/DEAH box helicase [Myxococcota bacterium]HRY93594.1 DEAD/DEAH box helicase [Myxococcota bacterium]
MDVFELRKKLVKDYANYVQSFIQIADPRIQHHVQDELERGVLWPEPLIQLNPAFEPGDWIDELAASGVLHEECKRIFRIKPELTGDGKPLRLHKHQADAVRTARTGANYVLTTGTGSGKSLAYIIPAVDLVLREGPGKGIKAIIVYPMNALANSQIGELQKFLGHGYPDGKGPITFARYTGQEKDEEKNAICANPPDILLTNFVMLELIMTRPAEKNLIKAAQGLRFLVLDELHTYRGRQGADVAMLIRRTRDRLAATKLQCVGTSATLAGPGSLEEQRAEVARVAGLLFGAKVEPEHVIGETLRRLTPERDAKDPAFVQELAARVGNPERKPPAEFAAFIKDPLSSWIESTFGLAQENVTGRLVRSKPRSVSSADGAGRDLHELTKVPLDRCIAAIQEGLLGGYTCSPNPETGFPAFAFRLHQFISRGDAVYASLEAEDKRHITLQGQQFVPGDRERILLPTVFCRECGQEYYSVRMRRDPKTGKRSFEQRDLTDRRKDDQSEPGYLHLSSTRPWPSALDEVIERIPEDWVEEHRGALRVRKDRREDLPQPIRVSADGLEAETGLDGHYLRAPFRFCLQCGVAYGHRQRSDFGKLSSLGSEGRSTATTILSLSAVRQLRAISSLPKKARKLLSFTDNRQDASLQAGHFNDFVEIGLLRSALYKACATAGKEGLRHEDLPQQLFTALNLPLEMYASDAAVRFQPLEDTKRALRYVLEYRIYRDLQRGWRVTAPNLEQCGLLTIDYLSLEDLCKAEDVWNPCHAALATATPARRVEVCRTLLDFMRRSLAIKAAVLTREMQEKIRSLSSQRLRGSWAIDDQESMEYAAVLFPRGTRGGKDHGGWVFLSPRGGFGQYLRRASTFKEYGQKISLDETQVICVQLLEALRVAGLVEVAAPAEKEEDVPGYQLLAAGMVWRAGEGTTAYHDPIRIPRPAVGGGRTNQFFLEFYKAMAETVLGVEAREHTAQVQAKEREFREQEFREGRLPILYCSPTMELGVDIAELNAVNLRNIPPTPANYAQRSGRAGRSGQPALVFSYCSTGSSHDQYFFKRPGLMVGGAVSPPRMDLANEDLIRAHLHAIWLAETGLPLGNSLKEILEVDGDAPTLALKEHVIIDVKSLNPRDRTLMRFLRVLGGLESNLVEGGWYTPDWASAELAKVNLSFDQACNRWRSLYRSALSQFDSQNKVIADASRSQTDKSLAKRLRNEAEAQLQLLTDSQNLYQADFYSYRYFASEGFLPGYNFPRLPLSAFIPGRNRLRDEYLSRPRFLAISEFGPRALVYHEGSKYIINRVIMPVREESDLLTSTAKRCESCGYLHPVQAGPAPDLCQRCKQPLPPAYTNLFRLQNVATRRRDKINSDEEERLRLGYDILTGVRFAEQQGSLVLRTGELVQGGAVVGHLSYGHASTLWRMNLGWARRGAQTQPGFLLDVERGYWAKDNQGEEDGEDDPLSPRQARVIPFVEDRRNSLLLEFNGQLPVAVVASLEAALKSAIQIEYQLEDNELAVEALPKPEDRRLILLYESSEGGAGVLRRLVDDPGAFAQVARRALEVCHFNPETGEDLHRAPGAREDCEAACYDCLMSYSNQPDHRLLDRKAIRALLQSFAGSEVKASPSALPRTEHLARLLKLAGSKLEESWLHFIDELDLKLPSRGQVFIADGKTRPDFLYDDCLAAIYVDGPPHDFPERHQRDKQQEAVLKNLGYQVIRFHHQDDWQAIVDKYPSVFGSKK